MIFTAQNIQDWLCHWLAQKSGFSYETIDPRKPFTEFGLDSLAAVELSQALEEWLGSSLSLDATIAWDYPTPQDLATFVSAQLTLSNAKEVTLQPSPLTVPTPGEVTCDNSFNHSAIAIVGMSCRFPGNVDSPAKLWQLLQSGTDAIVEVPADRWDAATLYSAEAATPGKMNSRWGGFLENVDQFDAAFFGISPREATYLDPQQRLLLEVCWHALEDAAIAPASLAGSRTGVFIGASGNDYARLLIEQAAAQDAYVGTGNALSILANRISYLLDLRGPSLTIDTACSSSLVAVHQACLALRQGECDLALVGGVNLILSPDLTVALSQAHMMASDGRCKTFDARADGYVRSEGVGVVVLRRLSDAQLAGDPILAQIRGSAINQDGRSNGLTAPNGPAQQAVIRQALHNANVSADQIGYVEMHGTGTALGDPIEVNSLKAIFDNRANPQRCWLGAVKANIGHLEAAAGIASLIKTVLCLRHQEIPRQLHLQQINPYIALDNSALAIVQQNQPWTTADKPRLAGVSSFGFGGTNAHLILEEAPVKPALAPQLERNYHIFTLSAHSQESLRQLAQSHADFLLHNPQLALGDICFTVNNGRNHFEERLAIVCHSVTQLIQTLQGFSAGKSSTNLFYGQAENNCTPVFLFSGQGSQVVNMGRQLYETQPLFRQTLIECSELLQPHLGESLIELLYPTDASCSWQVASNNAESKIQNLKSKIDLTVFAQPALFALEYSLVRLWQSWGIEPAILLGHSVGEITAACVAGGLSLPAALHLITRRGQLMQSLPAGGAMAAIFADAARVRQQLHAYGQRAVIAAFNATEHTVISGEETAIQALLAEFAVAGVEGRQLNVSRAFHSPLLDPMLAELEATAATITSQPLQLPLVSNLTGEALPIGTVIPPEYWRKQARQPVLFHQGLTHLLQEGFTTFIEVGPKPVLSTLGQRHEQGDQADWLPSLSGKEDDWATILRTLAQLYVHGANVKWHEVDRGFQRQRLSLPTYRFQGKRYWFPTQKQPKQKSLIHLKPEVPSQGNSAMQNNGNHRSSLPSSSTIAPSPRQQSILSSLRVMLAGLLHTSPDELSSDTPFLAMGADSIVLLEAVRRIEKEFGVKVQIRQFFEETSTLATLATYIAQQLPELVTMQPMINPLPTDREVSAAQSAIHPLSLAQQLLDIVTKQLDLLNRYDLAAGSTLPTQPLSAPVMQPPPKTQSTVDAVRQFMEASTPAAANISTEIFTSKTMALSEAQQQLWFLSQMGHEASLAYHESVSLWLYGNLQIDHLRTALQTLVDRHEALRTTFSSEGDVQQIASSATFNLPIFDLSGSSDIASRAVADWFTQESQRAIDLCRGPLFRVQLLKLAAEEYVLVLTAHHIIIDGLSMAVLLHEVSELYSAACRGEKVRLPAATQFSQHISWQANRRNTSQLAEDESYWLQRLQGQLPVLELPLDHARPPVQSYRGALESITLDGELSRALHQVSQQMGSTLFMTLLAAYFTLLHRISGQEDVIVGVPTAGREMAGGESIVGYCTHLLPIRNQLTGNLSFAQMVQQVRHTLLDAFQHREYPFARLVTQLVKTQRISRDLSLTPILNSTFNFNSQMAIPHFHGLTAMIGPRPTSFVDHDLSVNVLDNGQQLVIDFEYSADLFEPSTVKRLAGHFVTLLQAISQDVAQSVYDLPLLSPEERRQLLVDWNGTDAPFDTRIGFHQLFESQVAKTPDALAVLFEGQQLTYRQLNAMANGIAHQLRGLGVGRDTLVAILTERSHDFMAAMIGIFKAGGAYLPLDVRAPAARQSQILGQSRTPLLLISADFAALAHEALEALPAEQRPRLLRIEDLKRQIEQTDNLPLLNDHEDIGSRLAYVIYTSGSTGLPKGAMVEQRGMINHLYAKIDDLQLTAADTVAQTAPQSFDISVWQFLSTLVLGGRVHIFPDEIAGDPQHLLRQTAEQQITILEVVPSLLRMMLDEADHEAPDLSMLRWMIPTGEALPPNLARRWMTRFPAIPMINAYGPTECSDDVTHYPIFEPPAESVVNMPIGRPVRNMRMYILDTQRQPVPLGVAGELYVGGIGVGRGYIYDPERTAQAFVPDPFSADPAARLYKTGDKARYLANGNIEYLGRLDFQVKIRGFRIELGEIEAVLEQHPAIYQAVVVDHVDVTGNKRLVAYVVGKEEQVASGKRQVASNELEPATLRQYMNEHLPDYMVPSAFVVLDAIPLTPNGKTDRKALPAPDSLTENEENKITPPRTPTEAKLVDIWAEVLHLPTARVGIYQDFFEMGGHSLLATQAASRIRQNFAIDLPLRTYFNEPTIAGLATWIDATRWATESSQPLNAVNPLDREIGELL
ncbi:MAG: amino acid adenylation domain-containing protein [Caldilineaceae bacterium]